MEPTAEQQAVIDAAKEGGNLVVQAGAGTGKTSTLQFVADELPPERTLYVAYNKAIATDAATRFPRNVTCKTSHALAYGAVGHRYGHRLPPNVARKPSWQVAKDMELHWLTIGRDIVIKPAHQARIAADTVRRFCYSADIAITKHHVPFQNGITGRDHDTLVANILPLAKTWWDDANDVRGILPFEHDHYLKMWALTNPELPYSVIFLDEAQDSNPALSQLIFNQTNAQQIIVGDGCQQLYGWRGAIDAMKDWPNATQLYLQQSWRFGQAIADEANKWLAQLNTPLNLIGNPEMDSTCEVLDLPRAVLCRTNGGAMGVVLDSLAAYRNVALVGGGTALANLAQAAADLREGKSTNHPELYAFSDWESVVTYVNEDSSGKDLLPLVNLIEAHGTEKLIEATQSLVSEHNADVTVSTVHKAKGRQWDTVQVAGDFFAPRPGEGELPTIAEPEAMVGYVAVTRAQQVLDKSAVAWIDDLVVGGTSEVDVVIEELLGE